MAVRRSTFAIVGCLLGVPPAVVAADAPPAVAAVREAWQAGQSGLHELLSRTLTMVRRDRPEWLVERSQDALEPEAVTVEGLAQLVVQQDRRDGPDLLTLRYPLVSHGALRTYAGAGLNRAQYYAAGESAPVLLTRRNRQSSLGAAAEVGAELQLGPQLVVNADVRWADLDASAVLLRADDGFVGADPLAVGVSVGWRFH
jgi:hypothetical protein